ncbi:MAG: hypothetical protein IJ666_02675 [Ruminococcus sp.]|nr:hypothetical protein [Ruminococcus sp.]
MSSETVKKILLAEAQSDKKNSDARRRSEEIISDAERYSSIAIQKKLGEANSRLSQKREENAKKLEEYIKKADDECSEFISEIEINAVKNSDKAVDAVINGFFT